MELFMVMATLLSLTYNINGQPQCVTPDGNTGICVVVNSCQSLMDLVRFERTPENVDLLRKSACGFEGSTPKVCCPSCLTPSGERGQCVTASSCPHLLCNQCQIQRCPGSRNVCCPPAEDCKATVSAFPPNPKSCCCGLDTPEDEKILGVGGTETALGKYPWLILIEYQQGTRVRLFCGGALISGKYVLTAAHCVTGAILELGTPANIRLGEHNLTNETDCQEDFCADKTISVPIDQIIAHPEYDPLTRTHDIALIRMKEMAPYSDFIRPICLPSLDETKDPPSDFWLYVAGWGKTETQLQSAVKVHVGLPFVKLETCQEAYSVPQRNATLRSGQLCAGGEKGKDSCKGDSGGPLMYSRCKTYDLIGLVSFGTKTCGREGIPAIYTKVYVYTNWINSNIRP